MSIRLILLLSPWILGVCLLEASELRLKNGDRISGELIKKAEGKVYFHSAVLGDIAVNEALVDRIDEGKPSPDSECGPKQGGGKSEAMASSSSTQPAAPTLAGQESYWQHFKAHFKGSFEFGLNDQTGRQSSINLALRADAEYTRKANAYKLSWRYLYGRADGSIQSDHRDTTFRWRRQLNKDFFFQIEDSYANDRVKGIDLNLEQSAGLGYNAIKSEKQVFIVGMGSTAQYREIYGTESGTVALADLFEEYSYKISSRLNLKQDSSAQYSPVNRTNYTLVNGHLTPTDSEATNYRVRFNVSLQGKFTDHISLNLRYEYEYDNTITETGLRADQRITSSIGYTY
jgi:putative salt-induced outer membrane protein YdiY